MLDLSGGISSPAAVYTPLAMPGVSSGVVSIHAGDEYVCAIMQNGSVKCLGMVPLGESNEVFYEFTEIARLGVANKSYTGGFSHACVLKTNGAVFCLGRGEYGMLGNGGTTGRSTLVPVIGMGSGVAEVEAGRTHTCALLESGLLKCWGDGLNGLMGFDPGWTPRSVVDVAPFADLNPTKVPMPFVFPAAR